MTSEPSKRSSRFKELLDSVRRGDQVAAENLVDEYGTHILRAVRRRMNRSIRDRFDSQDFAQAVWASLFGNISVLGRINSETDLAGFLSRMASNKVIDAGRRQQKRPARNSGQTGMPEVVKDQRRLVSQPTPSQFAMAREQWRQLTANKTTRQQQMLDLLRNGASRKDVAEKFGVTERQVRRILSNIQPTPETDTEK